ncbi:MAG: type I 3-dehydroquinate dehydratase [Theionarchaea archaeon]|nr:type I 3-dehydroquinate dehydratase [Theionarchaea archaeon]
MICRVVAEKEYTDAAQNMQGLCEWRLDYLDRICKEDIKKIIEEKEVILTLRPTWCGGKFADESLRKDHLKDIMQLNPFCIDLELETQGIGELVNCAREHEVKYILSYHNFCETPPLETLHAIYSRADRFDPSIIKIITTANALEDNLTILRFNLETESPVISFCMGSKGILSRIFCIQYGSVFTYGGEDIAPGQLTVENLSHIYRILGWAS